MSKQPMLDVLGPERLLQQRVVSQVDHAEHQVPASPPVGMDLPQFLRAEGRALNRGSCPSVSAQLRTCTNFMFDGAGGVWTLGYTRHESLPRKCSARRPRDPGLTRGHVSPARGVVGRRQKPRPAPAPEMAGRAAATSLILTLAGGCGLQTCSSAARQQPDVVSAAHSSSLPERKVVCARAIPDAPARSSFMLVHAGIQS
jgi:hypothetical protein